MAKIKSICPNCGKPINHEGYLDCDGYEINYKCEFCGYRETESKAFGNG